jgi:hypothetical protein
MSGISNRVEEFVKSKIWKAKGTFPEDAVMNTSFNERIDEQKRERMAQGE